MDNVFLVTSGLNVESGVVSSTDRFNQTIETARSIRSRVTDAVIILLDGGKYPLMIDQRKSLLAFYDDVLNFTHHPTIQFAHSQNVNVMYIKGPCESMMLHEACKLLPTNVKRVFKISGRYKLSDEFDISQHDHRGKYVFKTKEDGIRYYHDGKDEDGSQLQNIDHYYTPYQYKTRLYSFCGSMLSQVIGDYQNVFQCMVQSYLNHGYIDIEHSMYRTLDENKIVEIDTIGLEGVQAENGIFLKE